MAEPEAILSVLRGRTQYRGQRVVHGRGL